jgi:aminoglycoside phosphotransferase (APT) family kinase protein
MGGGSGTSVLQIGVVVAKHYRSDFDDYSGLGPIGTANKVVALARELPSLGVPVPAVIDHTVDGTEALVVSEAIDPQPFTQDHRVAAARILRNLHKIEPQALSPELGDLIGRSRPNADRIRLGVEEAAATLDRRYPAWRDTPPGARVNVLLSTGEPPPGTALVHGDFFSVNLLAVGDGVLVIDWDLLSLGDPMWDLAFLVGADRDLDPALI